MVMTAMINLISMKICLLYFYVFDRNDSVGLRIYRIVRNCACTEQLHFIIITRPPGSTRKSWDSPQRNTESWKNSNAHPKLVIPV